MQSTTPRSPVRKGGAPAVAEHGFSNDVEADKFLGSRSPKPNTDKPDAGIPIEIAPHGQCRFTVSITPAKLMAGGSGTASILMIMEGDSVMESPTDFRIDFADAEVAAKSLLRSGAAVVMPPQSATLAAAYRGRQVYDNWAKIDLPITMSAEAPTGSIQTLDVEAHFRLHEGSTGRLFGDFCYPLTIPCEVGTVPDPAIQRSSDHVGEAGLVGAEPAATGNPGRRPAEQRTAEPLPAEPPRGAGAPDPVEPAPNDHSLQRPPGSPGDDPLFLLGSGLFVVVILLLFVRRR